VHRRIAVVLPMLLAAAIMAGLVLVAGTAIGSAAQSLVQSFTIRPALCTASYCEPAELAPIAATPSEPALEATATGGQPRR
jgi:hypothetical protein